MVGNGFVNCWRHTGITFQRTKTWKESNDPDRDAKLDRIDQVVNEYPDRTFAFDEFGPLNIRPVGGSCWAPAGEPQRQAANYHKLHGVRQFHGCYSVGDDTLFGVVRRRKSAVNTLAALRSIRKLVTYLGTNETRVVSIGRERLRQILGINGVTFQRTKTWKESNDPDRDTKLDRIEHVTNEYPDRTFAFDEFGPLTIRPVQGSGWAPATKPQRQPANYHKLHGVRQFHGCYSVGDDTLFGVVRERKSALNTLKALRTIRAARPDGDRIFVIMDNLSAHKGDTIRKWAKRNKVELCFTPTYTSWANPIEAHFGPLREFVLNNSNHPNHVVLTRKLHAYLRWRNNNTRDPQVLEAQRRERRRVRSEKKQRWGRPNNKAA